MSDIDEVKQEVAAIRKGMQRQSEYLRAMQKTVDSIYESVNRLAANSSLSLKLSSEVTENSSIQTGLLRSMGATIKHVQRCMELTGNHIVRSNDHQVDVVKTLTTLQEVQKSMAELMLADTAESDAEDMH